MNEAAIILVIYIITLCLIFAVPAAVIIGLAVKRKKEEEQKRLFFAQMLANSEKRPPENGGDKSAFYTETELSLKEAMHRRIHINPSGNGGGTLTVEFFSDDELAELAKKLTGER